MNTRDSSIPLPTERHPLELLHSEPLHIELLPIEHYVPHRGAMLLIDRLLEASAEHAIAEVCVPHDGLFVEDGGMPAWVGIEYMAQTVAAWAGWQAVQKNAPVRIGFLLGTRKFETFIPSFAVGTVLRVTVRCELIGSNGLGMFDCQIEDGTTIVARARISVFEPEDGAAHIHNIETGGPPS